MLNPTASTLLQVPAEARPAIGQLFPELAEPGRGRVLDAARDLIGAQQALVSLVDPSTGEVEVVAERGEPAVSLGLRTPTGQGLQGLVVAEQRPIRSGRLAEDPRLWYRELVVGAGL